MNHAKRTRRLFVTLLLGLLLSLLAAGVALATTGNIDATNKWAWGTNVGWLNFAPDNGGVTVYPDHLEGMAWAENVGWIRLGTCTGGSPCTHANTAAGNYGVNKDGAGALSGYAWATNVGWINFNPTDGGVTIDPVTGQFSGYAWGENIGWIRVSGTAQTAAGYGVQANFPDVAIVKTVAPSIVVPGGAITYTLVFSNSGAGMAFATVISDSTPVSVTVTGVTSSTFGGGVITQTSGAPNFAWRVSNLAVGAGGVITLTGTISPTLAIGGAITNTATITVSNDVTRTNNSGSAAVAVSAGACSATTDNGGTVFSSADAGAVRAAIAAASPGGTVKIAGYCAGAVLNGSTTQVAIITKTLSLEGGYTTTNWTTSYPITQPTTLDAVQGGRVIYATATATVQDLTVQNGKTTATGGSGGGIYTSQPITLSNVIVYNNVITGTLTYGGGAFLGGIAQITGTTFISNTATGFGGGAYFASSATIAGATFISNTAASTGGGAFIAGAATVTGAAFISNKSISAGGGGVGFSSTATLTGTTFSNNRAFNQGGGATFFGGTATLSGGAFIGNAAAEGGGATFFGTTMVSGTDFISNTAIITVGVSQSGKAGGAYFGGEATVIGTAFYSNTADQQGGGAWFAKVVTLTDSSFVNNTAGEFGGGLFVGSSGAVTVTASSILFNGAANGGALYQANGSSDVTASCIVANSDTAVNYVGGTAPLVATGNWWGHASGPSGAGPGVGDSVSANVNFGGFLGTAILGCPTLSDADVAIVKTASPSSPIPGGAITYTLAFSNTGQRFARAVVISDSVPLSVTVTGVASSGAALTQTGATPHFVWAVGDLAAGSGGVITLTGTVSNSFAVAGTGFTNTATIAAAGDVTFANNTGSAGVTVQPLFFVGGSLSGLAGSGLAVQNNGGDDLALTANGVFTFATPLLNGSAYSVTVLTQPANPPQSCAVTNGSGAVTGAPVSNVQIACTTASYALVTATAGTGAGSVTLDPAGGTYDHGTVVTVTNTPATGSTFTGWSGVCSGTGSCTVTMDAAKAVTATFTLNSYALITATTGTGAGSVTLDPAGGTYDHGTVVTVTNTAATGSTFTGWSGACSGAGSCTVTMDAAKTVTATFSLNSYALATATDGTGAGLVSLDPAGGIYSHGTVVTVTNTPVTGSTFTGWSGACSGAGSCTVTMDAAKTVTATFTLNSYALITATTGTGAGSVSLDPAGGTYDHGTVVTVTNTPATGSTFTGWSGACAGTGSCTVTMNAAKAVTATFSLNSYVLATATAGTGAGSLTLDPSGGTYSHGTVVTVTNTPATGSTFAGWSGACSGTGSCTVTMDAAKAVTATFSLNSYALATATNGTGTGSVTLDPAGGTYDHGTVVTVTNTPATGSTFTGWSGACAGTGGCVVTMDAAKTVTATFSLNSYALATATDGTGAGSVSLDPAGGTYSHGTVVTVTNTPATGSTFTGWSGACAGTGGCVVTMDAAKAVTATFSLNSYALATATAGTGAGSVSLDPAGGTYSHGTVVTVTNTPATGSTFTGWSGACAGTGGCVVTMDAAKAVTATFSLNSYALATATDGTGSGSVSLDPAGGTYNHGTVVTVTNTPATGSTFTGWSGACAGTGGCVVTMDAAKTVTATFSLNSYPLATATTGTGSGSVTLNPAGGTYGHGTVVTVTNTPATGSTFTDWSGACAGTGGCVVTMDAAKAVTATFSLNSYLLTTATDGAGAGSVTLNPAGGSYSASTVVTVTNTPAAGSAFVGWSGACSGAGTCTVTMDAAKAVTATFRLLVASFDMSIVRRNNDPVLPGATILWDVTLTNTGEVTTTVQEISATLTAIVEPLWAAASGGAIAACAPPVVLAVGEIHRCTLALIVPAGERVELVLTVSGEGENGMPATTTVTTEVALVPPTGLDETDEPIAGPKIFLPLVGR